VARLYQRAKAPEVAIGIICKSFKQSLCHRVGLDGDARADVVVGRLGPGVNAEQRQRIANVLAWCDAAQAGQRMSESELVSVAGEVMSLEEELGLAELHA
jgi:hypothetical protein